MLSSSASENGAAPSKHAPPDLILVPVDRIAESKTNPRKTFKGLDELAASIKEHGVFEPVLARKKQGASTDYELVFGARRLRAARIAGEKVVPLIPRAMTDDEVLEVQLVENIQRDDLHPLEEADAYELLASKRGYTLQRIAEQCGKTETYVHRRRKLAQLCEAARKAFLEEKIDVRKALLVARIPHADLQKAAVAEMCRSWRGPDDLPTYGECVAIVQKSYLLRLEDAGFPLNDAQLLPAAGSCKDCPKRTGNQRALFEDVKNGDTCSDPKCFREKRDAQWARLAGEAKTAGLEIIPDKQAKTMFAYGHLLSSDPTYVDLDEPNRDDTKNRTWTELLGKVLPKEKVILARAEDGKAHRLALKADAMRICKEKGYAFAKPSSSSTKKTGAGVDAKKEREKKERRAAMLRAITEALVAKAEAKELKPEAWRALARAVVRATWQANLDEAAKRRELAGEKGDAKMKLLKLAQSAKVPELRGLVFELLVGYDNAFELGPSLRECAAALGVDVKKAAADAAKDRKE